MRSEWIKWEWTPEKPYPETLDTKVYVMFGDGSTDLVCAPTSVGWWFDSDPLANNWHKDCHEDNRIVAYFVAEQIKPETKINVERLISDLKMAIDPLQHPENTLNIIKGILFRLGETV